MIRNYFKIAWRNLKKHQFYSGLNILGLFSGLTFTFLISAYIWGEFQVNANLKNAEQQVILLSEWKEANMGIEFTTVGPLAKRLKEEYPTLVENYFRWDGITSNISKGDKIFREDILIGDSTMINMFDFKLIHGNKNHVLKNPYSVLITATNALKYFGKTNVIGEMISIQNFSGGERDFLIEGVLKDIPKNSVTQLNSNNNSGFFIPSNTREFFNRGDFEDWNNIYIPSYIELKSGIRLSDLDAPIRSLINSHASEQIRSNLKIRPVYLTDYYLEKDNSLVKRMVYTLSIVGLFILIMAIINFVNISISAAGSRMKEIGVRKVMGSLRIQLVSQFLIEAFIQVSIATLLALLTYLIISPLFSEWLGTTIPAVSTLPKIVTPVMLALVVFMSLLAGLYPAFVLSSLNPVGALKGELKSKTENIIIRKVLVGFQFTIALVVLISSTIITKQINYFFGDNLGYNKEFVLSAQVPRDWSSDGVNQMEMVRNEFNSLAQIKSVSLSFEIPNGNNGLQRSIYPVGTNPLNSITMKSLSIDQEFLHTFEIPLQSGIPFETNGSFNATGVVLNEEALKVLKLGKANEAIGQQLKVNGSDLVYTVTGITNNFHFSSMHQQIEPVILFHVEATLVYRYLNFRLMPSNLGSGLAAVQTKWNELLPGTSFEYNFMDQTLSQLYESELQLKKATYNAALLSFIIVFLGVIGLVSLNIHQRIKEIGIRKVLGASSLRILLLFLKEFITIILFSCAVSFPLTYFIMNNWLNNYVYNIDISLLPFTYALLGLTVMVISLIGFMIWRSTNMNPVKNLRTE